MNNPADELSQAFKRKILAEDRDRMASYLDHANASADDLAGGRFAAVNKTTVTGASPISYPRLPANSPSNQAVMVGDEPSLGIDINAMDVVGEPHKQRASEGDGGLRRRGWRRL